MHSPLLPRTTRTADGARADITAGKESPGVTERMPGSILGNVGPGVTANIGPCSRGFEPPGETRCGGASRVSSGYQASSLGR